MKNDLITYIDTAKRSGKVSHVSVYFRDMNTGEWTGINETDTFEPASMLKVTTMLAYYKRSVNNPEILSKQLAYIPTSNAEENYPSRETLSAGYYDVNELIAHMIRHSDNDALTSLASIDDNNTKGIFDTFQLPTPWVCCRDGSYR